MSVLTFENLDTAYNGQAHRCMCGCAGDYADGNTTKAKRRFNQVMKDPNRKIQLGLDNTVIVYIENDTRITALYFK
jgi:hypothetical protein